MEKIAVMTGGGDCSGLNAAIRAVVLAGLGHDRETVGIRNGWRGLIDGDLLPLKESSVSGIISWGGTILGTSRTDPMKNPADWAKIKKTIEKNNIGSLIVIGGNGTLSAAYEVSEKGVPVVGIPKTIDNDIFGSDASIGFDTAISVVVEALDRLRTTAESHHRIMIVEVMGRTTGWIALMSGIAGGADMILTPEIHNSIDEISRNLKARYKAGKKFSVVVIAEGTHHEDISKTTVPE